ncbi:MAG: phosphoglycolate phosphatase [Allorhizobium sp.]
MTAATIVFDLDGTLVNTAPDLIASLNYTIDAAGLAPVTYDDLTHLVGQGAKVMIERAFALRGVVVAQQALPPLLQRFVDHYLETMPGDSKPFAGVPEALVRLSEAGFILAVCTNKLEKLAIPLMEKLGLADQFAAITGGDTFAMRKPDAGHLIGTIERAGGDPRIAIMVGDSDNDILAARNAGIPSIAVPFGYSGEPIESLGANRIIQHFDELTPALVSELLASH